MSYEVILSLLSLIGLQNVLGLDNEAFITLLTDKLPAHRKKLARWAGSITAGLFRIGLLFTVTLFLKSESELFDIGEYSITTKGLILMAGGVFLIFSSTAEIYKKTETANEKIKKSEVVSFIKTLFQILMANLLFSIESVITAVGVARDTWVMYAGVLAGVVIMLITSVNIGKFMSKHPSLKILAFCFLFIIGFTLICEGLAIEVPKTFIYFIMIFTVIIDFIYMKINGKKIKPA
ncbi:MAG: TerC family protein [Bacteroidetes bacterium]|nr:TerC family protein [Bacteroidota bacterium]